MAFGRIYQMSLQELHDRSYAGIYHNESDIEISKYLKEKIYYAKGFKGYVNRWGADDPDIQRQLGFSLPISYSFFRTRKMEKKAHWKSH